MNKALYNRNLLALSSQSSITAEALSSITSEGCLKTTLSRTSHLVPLTPKGGNPYHSTFDPLREAERLIQHLHPQGYQVVLGLGGGYHIREVLKRGEVERVFIIEKDIIHLKGLLQAIDFTDILSDPRVFLYCDDSIINIRKILLEDYLPVLYGNLNLLPLRSFINAEPEFASGVKNAIEDAANAIADDYTVQSYFGKQWYRNTILNLTKASSSHGVLKPIRKAVIIGAGPSLEDQLDLLKADQTIIATDTALPALLRRGIKPDLVISMDCQSISYLHFLQGMPREIPLVLDLASPPVLSTLSDQPVYFSSGHPLSQYILNHHRHFPSLDTRGGNISHTAISLAYHLGAEEITLMGIDFSYPEGKPYARGTYVYPYFQSRESRFTPLLDQTLDLVFKNSNIIIEETSYGYRYTTKPMINYKTRMEDFLRSLELPVHLPPTKGVKLNIAPERRRLRTKALFSAGPVISDLEGFLGDYLNLLEKHPFMHKDKHFLELSLREKDVLMTVLPTLAAFKRKSSQVEDGDYLKQGFSWCQAQVANQLS